jgi:hypothetical protein
MGVGVMRDKKILLKTTHTYTRLRGGRGYPKTEKMLKDERFESVRGECAI